MGVGEDSGGRGGRGDSVPTPVITYSVGVLRVKYRTELLNASMVSNMVASNITVFN